jgi:hypothetical protein
MDGDGTMVGIMVGVGTMDGITVAGTTVGIMDGVGITVVGTTDGIMAGTTVGTMDIIMVIGTALIQGIFMATVAFEPVINMVRVPIQIVQ